MSPLNQFFPLVLAEALSHVFSLGKSEAKFRQAVRVRQLWLVIRHQSKDA